jgi:hypothetical protein
MKKDSQTSKYMHKISAHKGLSRLEVVPVLDSLNSIRFSAQLPEGIKQTLLEQLIHDLRSAANAFTFLVDQLAFDLEGSQDERHRRKLYQLRQHDAMNKICINTVVECLENQIKQV